MAKRSMASDKSTARRDLFGELNEGMGALEASRGGKRTLRTHAVAFKPAPELTPGERGRKRKPRC
jgi:hypothetical protein